MNVQLNVNSKPNDLNCAVNVFKFGCAGEHLKVNRFALNNDRKREKKKTFEIHNYPNAKQRKDHKNMNRNVEMDYMNDQSSTNRV